MVNQDGGYSRSDAVKAFGYAAAWAGAGFLALTAKVTGFLDVALPIYPASPPYITPEGYVAIMWGPGFAVINADNVRAMGTLLSVMTLALTLASRRAVRRRDYESVVRRSVRWVVAGVAAFVAYHGVFNNLVHYHPTWYLNYAGEAAAALLYWLVFVCFIRAFFMLAVNDFVDPQRPPEGSAKKPQRKKDPTLQAARPGPAPPPAIDVPGPPLPPAQRTLRPDPPRQLERGLLERIALVGVRQ